MPLWARARHVFSRNTWNTRTISTSNIVECKRCFQDTRYLCLVWVIFLLLVHHKRTVHRTACRKASRKHFQRRTSSWTSQNRALARASREFVIPNQTLRSIVYRTFHGTRGWYGGVVSKHKIDGLLLSHRQHKKARRIIWHEFTKHQLFPPCWPSRSRTHTIYD